MIWTVLLIPVAFAVFLILMSPYTIQMQTLSEVRRRGEDD